MAFAIIQTCGKQYKAVEGEVIKLEKIENQEGDTVKFPFVVLTDVDGNTTVGAPFIAGACVEGEVVEQGRDKKIRVVHKQAKKRVLNVYGHRQPYTEVKITKI